MIFFAGNDGTIIKTLPSPVYQGAANTNTIYLFAPFATNLEVTVAFQLPTGVWTEQARMTPQNALSGIVSGEDGKTYAGWTYAIPNEITRYYGTVNVQFFFYTAQSGVITASSQTSFTVSKGVPVILPDTPSEDIYQQILNALSQIRGDLTGGTYAARSIYPWNSTYTYGINELVFYPNQGTFGVFLKSLTESNAQTPYVDGRLNTQYWGLVTDFNELNEIIVAQGEIFKAAAEAKADAASAAGSAANAGNAAQNASQSAQAAQQAADSVKDLQDDIEGILNGTVAVSKAIADETGANIAGHFAEIESLIPSAATPENQLADKAFVNSSLNNMAAFYITYTRGSETQFGQAFPTAASLLNATTFYSGKEVRIPTQNDYATVLADETQPIGVDGKYPTTRYSYQGGTYPNGQWAFQYVVNNTSLTQEQVNAINSGITAQKIASMDAATAAKYTKPTGGIPESDLSGSVQGKLNAVSDGYIKNLYNRGKYDTVTSNGNGRATITRKTGYIFSSDISSIYVSFKYYAHIVLKRAVYYNNQFSLISNLYPTAKNSNFDGTDRGIYFYDNLRVVIKAVNPNEEKTEQEWNDYLKSNNFCIQYELAAAYTDKVIENQPIHTLDQSGEEWIRDEWEKGLNLFDENSPYELGGWDGNTGDPTTPSDPTYRRYTNYISVKSNAVYTQNKIARVHFYDGNYKWLSSTVESTFTVPNNANYLRVAGGGAIFESYMLNEGSHPYPYESYYGKIVRTSDLSPVATSGSYNDLTDKPEIPSLYVHYFNGGFVSTGDGNIISFSFVIYDSVSSNLTNEQIASKLPTSGNLQNSKGLPINGAFQKDGISYFNYRIYKSSTGLNAFGTSVDGTGVSIPVNGIDFSSSNYQDTKQVF